MIVLEWLFLTIAPCDAAEPWQLGSQDAATPMMQGIIDLHHDIFFFLILILVFVSWILVRALSLVPLLIIHHMKNESTSHSSSSSSSSSNNKRREKEDCIRELVLQEVEEYLTRNRQKIMAEFPGARPYLDTTTFLSKVTTELIRGAGLMPTDTDPAPKMGLLNSVHQNLLLDFTLVKEEGYRNNAIYDSLRILLKDYR